MMNTPATPSPSNPSRRSLLASAVIGAGLLSAQHTQAQVQRPQTASSTEIPLVLPQTEFVYEAIAELSPALPLGEGPLGERRMVPITGGNFEGPGLRGKVLAGGADRQLLRKDGTRRQIRLAEPVGLRGHTAQPAARTTRGHHPRVQTGVRARPTP